MSRKRTRRKIIRKRTKFRKRAVAAGTAAAISLGTGMTLHKALAAFPPDIHQLAVAHDSDGDLLSDAEEKLCNQFDVIKMKNMYGKQVRGIERSTFLIDEKGVLRQEWRKVKVKGHVEEVLEAVKSLN